MYFEVPTATALGADGPGTGAKCANLDEDVNFTRAYQASLCSKVQSQKIVQSFTTMP